MKYFKRILLCVLNLLFVFSCGCRNTEIPTTEELEQITVSSYGGLAGGGDEYILERKDNGVFLTVIVTENWEMTGTKRVYKCPDDALMKVQDFMVKKGIWKVENIKANEDIIPDLRGTSWSAKISGKDYDIFSGQIMDRKYSDRFWKLNDMIVEFEVEENKLEESEYNLNSK